jgi:hypothetical protein
MSCQSRSAPSIEPGADIGDDTATCLSGDQEEFPAANIGEREGVGPSLTNEYAVNLKDSTACPLDRIQQISQSKSAMSEGLVYRIEG